MMDYLLFAVGIVIVGLASGYGLGYLEDRFRKKEDDG